MNDSDILRQQNAAQAIANTHERMEKAVSALKITAVILALALFTLFWATIGIVVVSLCGGCSCRAPCIPACWLLGTLIATTSILLGLVIHALTTVARNG